MGKKFPGTLELMLTSIESQNKAVEGVASIAVALMSGPAGIIVAYENFMQIVDTWAPNQKGKVRSAISVALAVLEAMVNGLLGGCEAITRALQELKAKIAEESGIIEGLTAVSDLRNILPADQYEKASEEAKEHFTDVCDQAISMCRELEKSTQSLIDLPTTNLNSSK